jgi:predicted MFS family arabinose efflux permease
MFGMFFFLTQFMQGVEGYSALTAGLAFLPMTLSLFATVQAIPRISSEIGDSRLLAGGLLLALIGMTWLSRISVGADYFTQMALPMVLLGIGMGAVFTPLTTAGISGVADEDAGAASGLVNTAHQLGGTLGIGILISVFTAAGNGGVSQLAEGVPAALTASAVLIALALVVVVTVMRPQEEPAVALQSRGA